MKESEAVVIVSFENSNCSSWYFECEPTVLPQLPIAEDDVDDNAIPNEQNKLK